MHYHSLLVLDEGLRRDYTQSGFADFGFADIAGVPGAPTPSVLLPSRAELGSEFVAGGNADDASNVQVPQISSVSSQSVIRGTVITAEPHSLFSNAVLILRTFLGSEMGRDAPQLVWKPTRPTRGDDRSHIQNHQILHHSWVLLRSVLVPTEVPTAC